MRSAAPLDSRVARRGIIFDLETGNAYFGNSNGMLIFVTLPKRNVPRSGPADKCRLVKGFMVRYDLLVEIPGIAIFLAERRNMVLRCFQDGFLAHVHKYLGFLVTDPVDMLR